MNHIAWHDIGRLALKPRPDLDELLLNRLKPGGSFMSYEGIQTCLHRFLCDELSLEQAKRWMSVARVPDNAHAGLIELLELLSAWSEGQEGQFVPFKNQPLQIAAGEYCRVHLSGLWRREDHPAVYWFFLRRVEALLGPDEIAFAIHGIREVLLEPELNKLPIVVVDCSTRVVGVKRSIKEYRDDELRSFSPREVDEVVDRYLAARQRIDPRLSVLRENYKQRPRDDRQLDIFD